MLSLIHQTPPKRKWRRRKMSTKIAKSSNFNVEKCFVVGTPKKEAGILPASFLLNSSIERSSILETETLHQPIERRPIDSQRGCCVHPVAAGGCECRLDSHARRTVEA